jgi:hypothetical protein
MAIFAVLSVLTKRELELTKMAYELIVGNLGKVHFGSDEAEARMKFAAYVICSESPHTRASGEDVTLLEDGEIIAEHSSKNTDD